MAHSDTLSEYRRRKLDLADAVRAALNLARERGDGAIEGRARDLLVRLAQDRFQLAVVGQFSRGKSTPPARASPRRSAAWSPNCLPTPTCT